MAPADKKPGPKDSGHFEPCELKLYLDRKLHPTTLGLIKVHLGNCQICSNRLDRIIEERKKLTKQKKVVGKMGDETLELWDKLAEALKEAEEELNRSTGVAVWTWRSSNGLLSVKILNFRLLFISEELGFENMSFYFRSRHNPGEKLVFSPRKTGGGVAAGSVDFRFQGGVSLRIE